MIKIIFELNREQLARAEKTRDLRAPTKQLGMGNDYGNLLGPYLSETRYDKTLQLNLHGDKLVYQGERAGLTKTEILSIMKEILGGRWYAAVPSIYHNDDTRLKWCENYEDYISKRASWEEWYDFQRTRRLFRDIPIRFSTKSKIFKKFRSNGASAFSYLKTKYDVAEVEAVRQYWLMTIVHQAT